MLVLHGLWSMSGGLCLWAEDSDLTVKSPSQAVRSAREMIDEKKTLADLVVTDGEGWLTELSTGDLHEVFALSEGPIDD